MIRRLMASAIGGLLALAVSVQAAGQGGAASASRGQQVFEAQKCSLCHSVAGKGNKMGSLDGVGSKLTAEEIRAWLVSPIEMAKKHNSTRKPPMKSFVSLPGADVDALVAYRADPEEVTAFNGRADVHFRTERNGPCARRRGAAGRAQLAAGQLARRSARFGVLSRQPIPRSA